MVPQIADIIIHIPNEGKRTPWEGKLLQRMGLRRGVSDFFIPLPRRCSHGLWIELKPMAGRKPSIEQLLWIDKMRALDFEAHVAYGWIEAKMFIESYLHS